MPKINSIAKNTSFFTLASIIQKIISFSYFAILARWLGPEDLGKYYLAISFTTIFAIIIDLGLANVLTRETARLSGADDDASKAEKQDFFRAVLAIKLPLALIALLSVIGVSLLMPYSELVRTLIYISAFSMIFDSFTMHCWAYMRGHHVLKYESLGIVLFQSVAFVAGYLSLRAGLGLIYQIGVMALASTVNVLYAAITLRLNFRVSFRPLFDVARIKRIATIALPFGLFAVLQRLYMFLDTLILSAIAGEYAVGIYQVSFKLVFALQFLPMAFIASLYPAFARYFRENREQLMVSFERAMNYLVMISLPISVGTIALSAEVLGFFRPEYMAAIWPLRVAMLALFFIFINFPIGSLLNACDHQKTNTRNMAAGLLVSVACNLLLIPRFGALGASITIFISNLLMFVLGMFAVPSIIKLRLEKIMPVLFKSMAAAIVMAAFSWYAREYVLIFINVAISAIIYAGCLFAFGAFRKEDVASVLASLKK